MIFASHMCGSGSLVYWTKIPSLRQDLSQQKEKRHSLFLHTGGEQWSEYEHHCLKHCCGPYK